jgi:NhaA family Na+:H+ antiporter
VSGESTRPTTNMTRRSRSPRPHLPLFQRFFRTEAAGGGLLLLSACAALIVTNTAWAEDYHRLWAIPVGINVMNHSLSLTLHDWINDGLMAVFFLLVGLEIKRELLAGELSSPRQAALPLAGALGGMVLPAVIYVLVNHTGIEARGWGIPMATDIAFALGVLTLITPSIPLGAKVFLTALAIVDDMGAVLVIAVFYTHGVDWTALTLAGVVLAGLVALNASRVSRLAPYILLGFALWLCVHASGIHSTIAGVLLAFIIPTRTRINAVEFSHEGRKLLEDFDRTETGDYAVLTSKGQQDAIYSLGRASEAVTAPLLRLEHALQGFSALVVMPLFALSNAGVSVAGSPLNWRVALGIAGALALGKPLGITAAAFGATRLNLAALPSRVNWAALHGCAWVGGIGFRMSLFIANLAFEGTALLDSAKLGILGGSLVGGLAAAVALRFGGATKVEEQ